MRCRAAWRANLTSCSRRSPFCASRCPFCTRFCGLETFLAPLMGMHCKRVHVCKLARITLTYLPTGDMSACSSGSPALLPVLQDLWPLLQTMTMVHSDSGHLVLLRDEGVCRGTFDLLSSLVSVLSLSLGAQTDLTQILDCVAQGVCMALRSKLSAASSALKTVAYSTRLIAQDMNLCCGNLNL